MRCWKRMGGALADESVSEGSTQGRVACKSLHKHELHVAGFLLPSPSPVLLHREGRGCCPGVTLLMCQLNSLSGYQHSLSLLQLPHTHFLYTLDLHRSLPSRSNPSPPDLLLAGSCHEGMGAMREGFLQLGPPTLRIPCIHSGICPFKAMLWLQLLPCPLAC